MDKYTKVSKKCADFCYKWKDIIDTSTETSTDDVLSQLFSDYKKLMHYVLYYAFNIKLKPTQSELIDNLGDGNWYKLQETENEHNTSDKDIASKMVEDIFYCSDKWSWDRFLRVNWSYLNLNYRVRRRQEKGRINYWL